MREADSSCAAGGPHIVAMGASSRIKAPARSNGHRTGSIGGTALAACVIVAAVVLATTTTILPQHRVVRDLAGDVAARALDEAASFIDKLRRAIDEARDADDASISAATTTPSDDAITQAGAQSSDVCLLRGKVSDCNCEYFQVDSLNSEIIRPRLADLVTKRFFRYFKVDLHCDCPFWPDDAMCNLPSCSVCECEDEGAPDPARAFDVLPRTCAAADDGPPAFSERKASAVDRTVAFEVGGRDTMKWNAADNPWLVPAGGRVGGAAGGDAATTENSHVYVDLLLNPERFTGYKGEHANRIWQAIYDESCFDGLREDRTRSSPAAHASFHLADSMPAEGPPGTCKEKQVLYRLISGIHSSITAHIAAEYPREVCEDVFTGAEAFTFGPPGGREGKSAMRRECHFDESSWGPNLSLFYERLGAQRLRRRVENLYFVYLFTLQAMVKGAPYFLAADYTTGNADEDAVTSTMIKELLTNPRMAQLCRQPFDEGLLWTASDSEEIKVELQGHFQNITTIMNCVGCEKCKVSGVCVWEGGRASETSVRPRVRAHAGVRGCLLACVHASASPAQLSPASD